jgi:hypothetical protein
VVRRRVASVGKPFWFREPAEPPRPPPYPVVEEYQIAFLCANFFLPGVTSEITLANVPRETR